MANNFIKHYIDQGIYPYIGEYDYNSVIYYLTASLLKSNVVTSNELSLTLNVSVKTAQRLLTGKLRDGGKPDLNTIVIMLNLVDYSIKELITDTTQFISNKYFAVDYTYSVFKPISREEYLSDEWDLEDIKSIIFALTKLRKDSSSSIQLKKQLLTELNAYPKRLIESFTYEQEIPSRKSSFKRHKVVANEMA